MLNDTMLKLFQEQAKELTKKGFELIPCDCDCSMVCPQGKAGSQTKCQIWKQAKVKPEPIPSTQVSAAPGMKTVIIYDQLDAGLKFTVVDGDYSHLNGVYINAGATSDENEAELEKKQDELSDLFYDKNGPDRADVVWCDGFPIQAVKDGAIVIVAGFLP